MEYKKAGRYLYAYLEDGNVAIAYMPLLSDMAGQILLKEKMQGICTSIGCIQVQYKGQEYSGFVYSPIPANVLEWILQQTPTSN